MGDRWVEVLGNLGDKGHVGVSAARPEVVSGVATFYLTSGITRGLLPVILARPEDSKFWIEKALPDPAAIRGGEFGLRFVPVPPRLVAAGLFPILESVSEAAVYAEDRGLRGVCVISSLAWNALQMGQEEIALQAEAALANLPFVHTILCVSFGAGGEADRSGFRRLHRCLLEDTPGGVQVTQSQLLVYQ